MNKLLLALDGGIRGLNSAGDAFIRAGKFLLPSLIAMSGADEGKKHFGRKSEPYTTSVYLANGSKST